MGMLFAVAMQTVATAVAPCPESGAYPQGVTSPLLLDIVSTVNLCKSVNLPQRFGIDVI